MKVLIVGLPLFAKRLQKSLTNFDSENKYLVLDTYYNKWDKIKAYFKIPKVDCIYSINGTISTSRAFDRAFSKNIPVVMNWVGTDVLKAIKAFEKGEYRKDYIENAIHFCEVNWIKDELVKIGIDAKVVSFVAFENTFPRVEIKSEKLKVLTYIPSNRAEFYGIESLKRLANNFPKIDFSIAGYDKSENETLPSNVNPLGWVEDMNKEFNQNHVCLRFPEHDGLSIFILESLARGKKVLYKYPFDFCNHCPDEVTLNEQLKLIENEFLENLYIDNPEGAEFIKKNYSAEKVYGTIVKELKAISHGR